MCKRSTHVGPRVDSVIGELELVEAERMLHPMCTGSWAFWMQVDPPIDSRLRLGWASRCPSSCVPTAIVDARTTAANVLVPAIGRWLHFEEDAVTSATL